MGSLLSAKQNINIIYDIKPITGNSTWLGNVMLAVP